MDSSDFKGDFSKSIRLLSCCVLKCQKIYVIMLTEDILLPFWYFASDNNYHMVSEKATFPRLFVTNHKCETIHSWCKNVWNRCVSKRSNYLLGLFKNYTVIVEIKHFQHNGVKTVIGVEFEFWILIYIFLNISVQS